MDLRDVAALAGVIAAGLAIAYSWARDRDRDARDDRLRAEDLERARRERFSARLEAALAAVLATSTHVSFLANLRLEHPRAVSVDDLFAAYRTLLGAFAEVSLLDPDLRTVAGDLAIAAQNLVTATTTKDAKWRWPDVQAVFDGHVRLYVDVVSKRLAR